MEDSPSSEANRISASQEIPLILRNLMVHCRIEKYPPPLSIPNHIDPIHNPTSHSLKIHITSHLRLGLPCGLFPSGFPTETLCLVLLSPICSTCPTYLILLDFITPTIFAEYRSLSSSLCSSHHSPVTVSRLRPNIVLNTLFTHSLSIRSSLNVSDQFSHPYKTIFKFLDSKPKDKRFCTE